MIRFALAVLLAAAPVYAQDIGGAAPRFGGSATSHGSIAFGWHTGSFEPSYSPDGIRDSTAGATLLSVRLATTTWHLSGETTMQLGDLVDRHAVRVERNLGGHAVPLAIGLSYSYAAESTVVLEHEELRVFSRRRTHAALLSVSASRNLAEGLSVHIAPFGGVAYVDDAFTSELSDSTTAITQSDAQTGMLGLAGIRAETRFRWRWLTMDGSVSPLWTPTSSSSVLDADVIVSGGIAVRTPWHVGFSVRATHVNAHRSLAFLGSSVTASVTASYP